MVYIYVDIFSWWRSIAGVQYVWDSSSECMICVSLTWKSSKYSTRSFYELFGRRFISRHSPIWQLPRFIEDLAIVWSSVDKWHVVDFCSIIVIGIVGHTVQSMCSVFLNLDNVIRQWKDSQHQCRVGRCISKNILTAAHQCAVSMFSN